MKVVVDTNVFVSAILSPHGSPAKILDLVLSRRIFLLLSSSILAEYREVLKRKEFSFDAEIVTVFLRSISMNAEKLNPEPCSISLPDLDDLPFLACALAGKAEFLITGNKKHFPEAACYPVKPISPFEFLEKIEAI